MASLPIDRPFERWLDYLFGCPVSPSGFRESDEWWDEQADPARAVEYLTRLFEQSESLLDRFPHAQIDRGLWYLASESGHLGPLLVAGVSWGARRRALLAIRSLYSGLFARACTNHLGHLDRGPEPAGRLNSSCYMWWDLFPTWGGGVGAQLQHTARAQPRRPRRRAIDRAHLSTGEAALDTVDSVLLEVMRETLRLESEACREGALHGLGHWHLTHPVETQAIIDDWLRSGPRISPELRSFAEAARLGCVN